MRLKRYRVGRINARADRRPISSVSRSIEDLAILKLKPGGKTARLRQSAILQAQKQHGNAFVQRMLAQRNQRTPGHGKYNRFSAFTGLSTHLSQLGLNQLEIQLVMSKKDPNPLIRPLNDLKEGAGDRMANSLNRVSSMREYMRLLNSMVENVMARSLKASKG